MQLDMPCLTAHRGVRLLRLLLHLALLPALVVGCGAGPERKVLVVVNGESPISVAIGEYYLAPGATDLRHPRTVAWLDKHRPSVAESYG